MDVSRYTELFLSEAGEHISGINRQLLVLESDPVASEPVEELFRSMHTIKGMAAAMGFSPVAELAHELENVLDGIRRAKRSPGGACIDMLFRGVDALERLIEQSATENEASAVDPALLSRLQVVAREVGDALEDAESANSPGIAGEDESAPTEVAEPDADAGDVGARRMRSVRVEANRLDTLMNQVGELVILRDRLRTLLEDDDRPELLESLEQATRMISDLQDEVVRVRMIPVGQVFDRFPRLVRDMAKSLRKRVRLEVKGRDTRFDRSMLEEIGDPLIHLLRNAVDHGIETPEFRRERGKPEVGTVHLEAMREQSRLLLRIRDDGRGISREAVLSKAVEAGLVHASETSSMSDEEVFRMLTRAGFSTAERVTDISGRGVGLDVVAGRVRALGGTVQIESREGEGATFTIRLPVTLAIVQALFLGVGEETYVLPMAHVTETVELGADAFQSVGGREAVLLRDHAMPVSRLRNLLRGSEAENGAAPEKLSPVVVLDVGGERCGLVVDCLHGQREVVVKSLDVTRGMPEIFSGGTILADGRPALILDASGVVSRGFNSEPLRS